MKCRSALVASMMATVLLAGGAAKAENPLFYPNSLQSGAEFFGGYYLGSSVGYGDGGATVSTVFGHNWVLNDLLLLGTEIAGKIYNEGDRDSAYMLSAKAGVVVNQFSPYALVGVGYDSRVARLAWRASAGVEYALTSVIGLSGEVSSTQTINSFGDVIEGQIGLRVHYDGGDEGYDSLLPAGFADAALSSPMAEMARRFGVSEIRGGLALSNLELAIHQQPFEPDVTSFSKARLDTVQADIFFNTPALFEWIGSPRLQLGAVVNLQGYESMAHAGLDWHLPLGELPLYVELGAGLAVHNGYLTGAPDGYRNLGCSLLHEWQYGLGYNLNESVTVTAQWKHVSGHFFGCMPNEGINTLGLVAGLKF